jgi:hypothetical protein
MPHYGAPPNGHTHMLTSGQNGGYRVPCNGTDAGDSFGCDTSRSSAKTGSLQPGPASWPAGPGNLAPAVLGVDPRGASRGSRGFDGVWPAATSSANSSAARACNGSMCRTVLGTPTTAAASAVSPEDCVPRMIIMRSS